MSSEDPEQLTHHVEGAAKEYKMMIDAAIEVLANAEKLLEILSKGYEQVDSSIM